MINPNISHDMNDGALFPEEVEARQIMPVPTIYHNGEEYRQSRMGDKEFLRQLETSAVQRDAEQISAKNVFDTLVVGPNLAGAAAAIYAARKGIRTGMLA